MRLVSKEAAVFWTSLSKIRSERRSRMPDRPWTREEVLLTINLYCKLPYRKLRQSTPEVKELALLLNRTPSAISKRCCNYVQFDPVESQRVKGFTRAAKLDKSIWAEINCTGMVLLLKAITLSKKFAKNRLDNFLKVKPLFFLRTAHFLLD